MFFSDHKQNKTKGKRSNDKPMGVYVKDNPFCSIHVLIKRNQWLKVSFLSHVFDRGFPVKSKSNQNETKKPKIILCDSKITELCGFLYIQNLYYIWFFFCLYLTLTDLSVESGQEPI